MRSITYFGTNLISTLSSLQMYDFTHDHLILCYAEKKTTGELKLVVQLKSLKKQHRSLSPSLSTLSCAAWKQAVNNFLFCQQF